MNSADIRASAVMARFPDREHIVGAEVGVFKGALSRRLLGDPCVSLIMIDSWEGEGQAYNDKQDWHAGLSDAAQLQCYFTTLANVAFAGTRATVIRERSLEAAAGIENGSLDFVFLDADHSYQAVKADIKAWASKVRPGGWIGGHDYMHPDFPGVQRAVDELGPVEFGGDTTWFHWL